MSEAIFQKYAQFVDLLLAKTKQSKIAWDFDSSRAIVSVWNNDVLLNIKCDQDENFEDAYSVSLINRSGAFLETFNDNTLSEIEVEFDEDNYYVRLQNLYNLAMRQATGADKALDDFMEAVRTDRLDLPF